MSVLVIVPSRGRPKRAVNMVQSVRQTATGSVTVVVGVDADDPELPDYQRKVAQTQVIEERIGYSGTLNLIAAENPGFDIYGAFGDDVLFETLGWDAIVNETLSTPGIAFPNDLAHGAHWPTAVFMSGVIVRALGWIALPTTWHLYADNAWKRMGEDLDILRYMPTVICEHMHEAYGKAPLDQTYREVYSEPRATDSYNAFHHWDANDREADEAKIRAVLG